MTGFERFRRVGERGSREEGMQNFEENDEYGDADGSLIRSVKLVAFYGQTSYINSKVEQVERTWIRQLVILSLALCGKLFSLR